MKKIEYIVPEMEEIKLMHTVALLDGSGDPDPDQTPDTGDAGEL